MTSLDTNNYIVIARAPDAIVNDFEASRECIKLLHTIHSDVIEAIITNTIAYRWKTDPEFRRLTHSRDNLSGIHLAGFVTEGRNGKYLTLNENLRLGDNMKSYLGSKGIAVPVDAPDDPEASKVAEKAAKIDGASIARNNSQDKLRKAARAGQRQLTFADQYLALEKLEEYRICPALDPTGEIQQIQTPCQVGCATNMLAKSAAHDPQTIRKTSSAFLTLTMSTLEVMKFK